MLDQVTALRYLDPLRAGGSVPGVVETDDLGTYVVKFTGAAQGAKALVAEVIVGELARRLGLRVPPLVLVDFDPAVAAHEPDTEIQDILRGSAGLNLGMDLLPGARDFTPGALPVDPLEAGRIVWLDALTGNVDRTVHNPNLMVWHRRLWLIDNGAGLIFHHRWSGAAASVLKPYPMSAHALGAFRPAVAAADEEFAPRVTGELLREVVDLVPEPWLADEPGFDSPQAVRDAYVAHLAERAAGSAAWLPTEFASPEELRAAEERRAAATMAARPAWLKQVPNRHGLAQVESDWTRHIG
ncbi:HipA family kinase [Streptomyces sp. NRRL B-24484]|uniref:HipA family kinase n=1 Tax=Streptomyces sp. NRRL B-24484 TaxID=1463833 RepID=UPI0004C057A2|nr:HipA family kinase [Streptomyces sp. NRRL B-24484]